MDGKQIRRWAGIAICIMTALAARAADITVAFVTPSEGKTVSVEERQVLWKSPFGGWGITAWPFSLRVDDTPILEYSSAEQKLLDKGMEGGKVGSSGGSAMEDALGKTFGGAKEVRAEDLMFFRLDRLASATLNLSEGRHMIKPFGLEFTVAADGTPATRDTRLRIDAKARRVEVVCHPVVVKMVAGKHSVSGPLQFSCASKTLLGGLNNLFDEYDKQNMAAPGTAAKAGFRRVTLYLPPSVPGAAYEVNGVKFDLDTQGRIKLAAAAGARCPDGREIYVERPAAPPPPSAAPATQPIGVSWFGAPRDVAIACGSASAAGGAGTGSAWLPVPATGARTLGLDNLTVSLPAANPRWPHELLIWDVAGAACWTVETAPLAAKPGAEWSCRVKSAAGKAPIPASLKVRLEAVAGGAAGGDMALKAAGDGVFSGALPAKPGLWRLRVDAGGDLLKGQTLGLALIADKATAAVSLFTVNNRALYRRGDAFDLLWSAKLPAGQPAAAWPVVLHGPGLAATVGKLAVPSSAAAGAASGAFRLDTAALAPGVYTVAADGEGVAGYPFKFRVCQREPLSDFELSTFGFKATAKLYPGAPVTEQGDVAPSEPGLAPFLADGDGALDGALAAYATAPCGPAVEAFARPTPEELTYMAVAAMGMRATPYYPRLLSMEEDRNPKHTLPEDLAQMRRRMALHVQQHADFPGLDGYTLGWYASRNGSWENTVPRDGHQGRRNAEAGKWVEARLQEALAKYKDAKLTKGQRDSLHWWLKFRAESSVLSHAYMEWFADALQIRPGLTLHNNAPTFWLGQWDYYPPTAWAGESHRGSFDYTDYANAPWPNFRAPAFLAMGNQSKQKLFCAINNNDWRAVAIPMAFGAAGRGIDGLSVPGLDGPAGRIFERFGSWFTALDPLPDVAVYCTLNNMMPKGSVIMHDLARMRRPGMFLAAEDLVAGELAKYRVLLLAGIGSFELPEIDQAVKAFEAKGGVILKDDACAADLPGRKLGFAYDGGQIHGGWGLGGPNGQWEFDHLWDNFKKTREKFLVEAFAKTPGIPVGTPDADVIVSPLAGKDSILCFVINQTVVPLEFQGQQWRQMNVLPRIGELRVEKGWYIHDVLAGKAATVKNTAQGQSIAVDFTRLEGALYLLTKREPKAMAIRTERTAPETLRLTGWLADAGDQPLADPMPFEVTLKGPDGATLFHKLAALGPETAIEVPVPALSGDAKIEIVARDLILGATATQAVVPAAPAAVAAQATPDLIGGADKIAAFLAQRKGPVTVLLDEEQDAFRPAAEQLAALLKKSGREARVVPLDLSEVRPLNLRWVPLKEDLDVLDGLTNRHDFAWRVAFPNPSREIKSLEDPRIGYDEYGPRLRHDADVVLFGAPANHRVLADLAPFLRRVPSDNYPAPGGFFVHYLWSPFQGGYDGLYLGCHDAAGAQAAVACLATVAAPAPAPDARPDAKPVITRGGAPAPLKNMVDGDFGTLILDAAFTPSGKRMYVTTTSYGDWFFVFSPTGDLIEKRSLPVPKDFPNSYQWGRHSLRPVDETSLRMQLWDGGDYLYQFDKGWLSKAGGMAPPHYLSGLGPNRRIPIKASTRLDDGKTGRIYFGGNDQVMAIDDKWNTLWRFADSAASADLCYPRGTFPFAVSGNGRVLLVSAFGVHNMDHGAFEKNPTIMGLDTATGKLLWQRGMFLNAGKAVALDDRFMVIDDKGASAMILAADGKDADRGKSMTGSADWIVSLPGRREILIVENDHFDRQSRTARVYIRSVDKGVDRDLKVSGRVTTLTMAPDNQSFLLATSDGWVLRFASDGTSQWKSEVPGAHFVRFSPDAKTLVVGTTIGILHFLNAADGKSLRKVDLNPYNVTTGERFVKQERMGDVPVDAARKIASLPEPSYVGAFDPKKVAFKFGPNLTPPDVMRAKLKPAEPPAAGPAKIGYVGKLTEPVALTFKVEAKTTYIVELLDAVANPADHKPTMRLEVAVKSVKPQTSKNLPYTARLPLGPALARHRAAFRADAAGEVTLTLSAIMPKTAGEGRQSTTASEKSEIPVLLGDVVVSALKFPGKNVLFDGGPGSGSNPAGTLRITGFPHEDGVSDNKKDPFSCPAAALKMVNGLIANQETGYAGAGGVDRTEIVVGFSKPQTLSALVIYEDPAGPTPRYSIDISNAANGQWTRLGMVADNTQLINIFPCPAFAIGSIRYMWASRFDNVFKNQGDGSVRLAQFEAYSAEDVGSIIQETLESDTSGLPTLD